MTDVLSYSDVLIMGNLYGASYCAPGTVLRALISRSFSPLTTSLKEACVSEEERQAWRLGKVK